MHRDVVMLEQGSSSSEGENARLITPLTSPGIVKNVRFLSTSLLNYLDCLVSSPPSPPVRHSGVQTELPRDHETLSRKITQTKMSAALNHLSAVYSHSS